MPVGLTECENCGEKIPYPPKPVKWKYDGKELCEECRGKFLSGELEFDEDG